MNWARIRNIDQMRDRGTWHVIDEPAVRVVCRACGHPATLDFPPRVRATLRCLACGTRQVFNPRTRAKAPARRSEGRFIVQARIKR